MNPGPNREIAYHMAGSLGYGYRQVESPTGEKEERKLDAGENPPSGVIVHYWLREVPAGELVLAFLDGDGREIRSFTSRGNRRRRGPGGRVAHRRRWGRAAARARASAPGRTSEPHPTKERGRQPLRVESAGTRRDQAPRQQGARRQHGHARRAPRASRRLPGAAHRERPDADAAVRGRERPARAPPRTPISGEQYPSAKKAHDLLTRVHDAVLGLRAVRAQAEGWASRVATPAIKSAAAALARTLTAIEEELIQVRSENPRMFPPKLNTRIGTVVPLIEYSDSAPTQALRDLTADLARRAEAELAKLDRVLAEDVARFNALCKDAGVAAIVPKPRVGA